MVLSFQPLRIGAVGALVLVGALLLMLMFLAHVAVVDGLFLVLNSLSKVWDLKVIFLIFYKNIIFSECHELLCARRID